MRRRLREIAAQVVEALELEERILEDMTRHIEIADDETREQDDLIFVERAVTNVRSLINHVSSRGQLYSAKSVLEERQSTTDPESAIAVLTIVHLIERHAKKRKAIWLLIRRRLEAALRAAQT
jgi:hypothetical protein